MPLKGFGVKERVLRGSEVGVVGSGHRHVGGSRCVGGWSIEKGIEIKIFEIGASEHRSLGQVEIGRRVAQTVTVIDVVGRRVRDVGARNSVRQWIFDFG